MRILGEQVGTENQRLAGRNIKNGGVVANGNNDGRFESFANFSNEAALAEIFELHTVASAPFGRRLGPRRGKAFEYVFYVDLMASTDDPKVGAALEEVAEHTSLLRVLGSYRAAAEPI